MNFNQICVWAPIYLVIFVIAYMEIMMIYIFINPEATEIVLMILHHLLLLVVIYLFFKTITTQPGTPTYQYTEDDPLVEWRKICKHCQIKKPLRCHHCAACNKCILRMSNHSFWLNNCIGQKNYKYFFCLLFYLTLTLIFYFFVFLTKVIKVPPTGQIDTYFIIFTVLSSLALMIGVFCCLGFHFKLIINNQTNVEYFEKQQEHYDKGFISNCNELLGPGCWINPI